jgi:hypothetical protein
VLGRLWQCLSAADTPLPPVSGGREHDGRTQIEPSALQCDRGNALLADGIEGRHRIRCGDAARLFVGWLQRRGDTGMTRFSRLQTLYSMFCIETNLAELPVNQFFKELAALAPKAEQRVPRDDAYRQRSTTYDIPCQLATFPIGIVPHTTEIAPGSCALCRACTESFSRQVGHGGFA